MREYVATAKTVEEAIQLGCEALSVDREMCIRDRYQPSFLKRTGSTR